ncbi:MAG: hypothetical protein FJ145_08910 [Deltaproteobacteria bacterium]|nr:hypothetical protein [Deltaproteobacteria bacterium]
METPAARGSLCATVLGLLAATARGFAGEADLDLKVLREELAKQRAYIEQLEKRVQAQETKGEAQAKAQAEALAKLPAIEAGYEDGFYIRSKDKPFSLVANGFGQFRYTFNKAENTSTNHTFDVGLARLALSGKVFDPKLSYFMQIQGSTLGNNNNITMLDWWMKYGYAPEFGAQVGRFVLPYSRQFYTHPGNLLFSDLSEADYAFNLPRSIGAHVSGKIGPLSYHAAALNSIRALDAPGQQNFSSRMGALGRLELDILKPYGYNESSPKPAADPELSVGFAAAYNPIEGGSSFQNLVRKDTTTNLTLDLGFRWERLALQAAGYYRHDHFTTPGRSSGDNWGYYSQLGFYVVPAKLELAGRISGVEFDKANVAGVARKTTAYTAGLNYYYIYGHNLKLQSDYSFLDNSRFSGQPSVRDAHRIRLQTQFLF